MLLVGGANINVRNMKNATALHIAVEDKKMDIIGILLNHGANVEIYDSMKMTPLHTAVKNDSTDIVKLLLSRGANANTMNCPRFDKDQGKGCTPLQPLLLRMLMKKLSNCF